MSPPAQLRSTEVMVDGVRSPVLQAGTPRHGEAVVFIHGNPGSSRDWELLLSRVGEFAHAVAYDLPGFGRADKPADFDYSVPGYARHLGGVLSSLGARRVHLVVHDFGGPIGLAWAAVRPDWFASAVLINSGVLLGYQWHYLAKIWRAPVLGELFQATATRAGFRMLLKHGNPKGLPRGFVNRLYDDYDRGTRRAVLKLYRASDEPGRAAEGLRQALAPLDRPALVIWGRHDPYIPVAQAERQRETFPRAEVVVLDGSGHWPFADDPERVAELVTGFLGKVVTP